MFSVLESAKKLTASAAEEMDAASRSCRLSRLHGDSALTLSRGVMSLLEGSPETSTLLQSARLQAALSEAEEAVSKAETAREAAERASDLINSVHSELVAALILEQSANTLETAKTLNEDQGKKTPDSNHSPSAQEYEHDEESAEHKFVTDFKESDVGRKVKLVGKNWPKSMKKKIGTIEGFGDPLLLVSGIGNDDVKPFLMSIGEKWEFKYVDADERKENTDEEVSEIFDGCKNCKKSPCSHGKFVLPDDLKKSLVGSLLKYRGNLNLKKGWSNYLEICSFSDDHQYLNVRWSGQSKDKRKSKTKYALFSKTKNGLEFQFQYHCANNIVDMEENSEAAPEILSDPHAPIVDVESDIRTEEEIQELIESLQPKMSELEARQRAISVLTQHIQTFWPSAELTLFGSSNNGFAFKNSDLDLSLTFRDIPEPSEMDTKQLIEELGEQLRSLERAENVTVISTARVPIVKLVISHIAVDLSLYNLLGLENTGMLRLYSRLDPRARQLGYLVKHLAKTAGIGDLSRGSLSSYAYILMVIFYLQVTAMSGTL